ncbi:MAG: RNA polymerase sigma factor SigE [Elusimicrobia bacterium]|nr:MAG: RNA polymerase sigma factor SigE [Elusimicrobiota bacterium]
MIDAKQIVEQYTPFAYTMAFRLTGNQAEAWDLTQNAMLRVMRSFSTYDPKYKVEQWLYRIVKNLFIDRKRQIKRKKEAMLERDPRDGGERLAPVDTLVDTAATPEQTADREDRRDAVQAALMTLPDEMKVALTLVDIEGFSYEEAGRILEIPSSTLGVRVYRGRKLMKERLKPFMEGQA